MTEASPVMNQLNIVVRDMDAAVDFYMLLGLTAEHGTPPWDAHHRWLSSGDGGIQIALDSDRFTSLWDRGWPGRASGPWSRTPTATMSGS